MEKPDEDAEVPVLGVKEEYEFPADHECVRLNIEWISKMQGLICDLDLNVLCYDERARLCEKVDSGCKASKDASCLLLKEAEGANAQGGAEGGSSASSHLEYLKLDFRIVDPSITAIVLYLDGGPRNFQFLQSVNVQCTRVFPDRSVYSDFLPSEGNTSGKNGPLFRINGRTRKNYQGMVLCVLYKDGWHLDDNNPEDGSTKGLLNGAQTPRWVVKGILEPLYVTSSRDKQVKCDSVVVNAVPALEKYRPRLFASIREICAALSSHSLPKLKKKFQKGEGLAIGQFTEVLFKQLYETHPKIVEDAESAYAVAMLQEMFHQIDYNGDGNCNWDEFTTFCVQTGLLNTMSAPSGGGAGGGAGQKSDKAFSLDQYVIEYGEEALQRDRVLSAYRYLSLMRYIPDTRKICVISEDADNVMVFDEKFRLHSQLYPSKLQIIGSLELKSKEQTSAAASSAAKNKSMGKANGFPRVVIYDIIYLTGRDMYCYTSSDHCITICKEFSSMGGRKINYQLYNRFYHTLLHLKLCWSSKHDLLCSVGSDKVIYGWDIDSAQIVFQVARHNDIITDFLAVDPLDIFITCSMDKRIVLWSATSRRVKGVLLGHKRGVRCLSVYDNTLLSAGFEVEAKTWDLTSKDCVAVLKGHRHPVAAAKLMCDRAPSEKEYRAITVDESGEFRLWNIYVRERSTDPVQVPTLQIFEMQHPETPVNEFRFLALPYNPKSSTSYYSDLIACSTKLLHFLPEKNTKEFVPPTGCLFNESTATIMTAFGRSIITYDLSSGNYSAVFEELTNKEISSICLDGQRGRKMYVGTSAGEVLLVNSTTGMVLDQVEFHNKEVTSICQRTGIRNCVYSVSLDGHIRLYDESNGKLHLHNSLENAFGEGVGITRVKSAPTVNLLIATSAGKAWGIFHDTSMKKLLIVHQKEVITAFEIVGASRDQDQSEHLQMYKAASGFSGLGRIGSAKSESSKKRFSTSYKQSDLFAIEKENLLTIVLAMASSIVVYTVSAEDMRGVKSFELVHDQPVYINELAALKSPDLNSVNYSAIRSGAGQGKLGLQLLGVTDDGGLIVWDTDTMRFESESLYRKHYKGVPRRLSILNHKKEAEAAAAAATKSSMAAAEKAGTPVESPTAMRRKLMAKSRFKNFSQSVLMNAANQSSSSAGSIEGEQQGTIDSLDNSSVSSYGGSVTATPHASKPGSRNKTTPNTPAGSNPGSNFASPSKLSQQKHSGTLPSGNLQAKQPAVESYAWAELDSDETFPLPLSQARPQYLKSSQGWAAHNDTIVQAVPLHTHGCMLTVSHDGYHRMWNVDAQLLGEVVLPNITEAMKLHARCTEPGTKWRFILERIPITPHHIELAALMVRNIKQAGKLMQEHSNERRHLNLPIGFKGFREGTTGILYGAGDNGEEIVVDDEQSMLRKTMLRSLTETPLPSTELPPTRLPTKEEKELIKLSLTVNAAESTTVSARGNAAGMGMGYEPSLGSLVIGEQSTVTAPPLNNIASPNLQDRQRSFGTSSRNRGPNSGLPPSGPGSLLSKSMPVHGGGGGSDIEEGRTGTRTSTAGSSVRVSSRGSSKGRSGRNGALQPLPGSRTASRQQRSRSGSPDNKLRGQTLRSSAFFGGESSVLMSAFGGDSLWAVPGEKDIFGNLTMTLHQDAPDSSVPPAFSELSLNSMRRAGLIDIEGMQILRKVAASSDRVQVYDRSQPTLLVRSPALSASVELPPVESMRLTEISFGPQKDMYKNAERVLNERDNISKTSVRAAVAKSRIDQNVRKIGSMIHLIQPPSHDEVILPKGSGSGPAVGGGSMHNDTEEMQKLRSEEQRMKLRLLKSAALVPPEAAANIRPLDRRSIDRWVSKMNAAVEPFHEGGRTGSREGGKQRRKKESLSQSAIHALEKKLQQAIRADYRARTSKQQRPGLTAPAEKGAPVSSGYKGGAEAVGLGETAPGDDGTDDADNENTAVPVTATAEGDVKDAAASLISAGASAVLNSLSRPSSRAGGSALLFSDAAATAGTPKATAAGKRAQFASTVKGGTGPAGGSPPSRNSGTADTGTVPPGTPGTPTGTAGAKSPTKITLTTRQLLPYYKLESVHQFMDIFAKVDENFSGDLDVNEWIRLFTSLNESVPVLEARMIFMKIDKDSDGYLTMRELIPVVFNKATREQQKLIIQYAELELTKKIENESIPKVTNTDLEFLFEAYDTENIGFVDVALIKERIRNMYLSEQALFHFMETIADMADDEMVNITEFKRLFRAYTSHK